MNIKRTTHYQTRRGLTLTELVVVLAIVSVLATIMIPMAFNRAEQARIATAHEECRVIAEAQMQCAAIHGFYVPIRLLDNLHSDINPNDTNDDIENELNGPTVYLISSTRPVDEQLGSQAELSSSTIFTTETWNGPFLQPQRVYEDGGPVGSEDWYRDDYPLDPWGNPYRFYSRLGPIGDSISDVTDSTGWTLGTPFNGQIQDSGQAIHDDLDRFAIVSYGPDGEEDLFEESTDADPNDDIVYQFGAEYTVDSFKPFY